MVEVSCSTGGADVIASGLGITYAKDAGYDIHVKFEDGFNFTVRLKFVSDDPDGKPEMRTSTDEESRIITVECRNADDFIGSGTTAPFELGTWHGGKITMNYWVRTPDSGGNREVRYCIYMEGVNVGG